MRLQFDNILYIPAFNGRIIIAVVHVSKTNSSCNIFVKKKKKIKI